MTELRKMSNYPGGFRTGVSVRGLPILNTYGGRVFWVDSNGPGGDSGNGTYHRAFASIDYAIGRCTADNGDIIICKAGHAETLTTAGGITCDVAGVTIIAAPGAVGALRPALTFASTDNSASVIVSADNVSIAGLLGTGGDDGLTAAFVVTGDNPYIDIEWQDASAAVEAACAVQFNTANNVRCILKYAGFVTGNACLNAIQLIDCDNVEIDIDAYGEFSTGIVEMLTTASTNVLVRGYFYNDNVALTKNVVNTGGLACTWFASGYDGKGGYAFSGGSAAALASDDTSTLISVLGALNDAAAAGAVTDTDTAIAYLKQIVTEGIARDAVIGALNSAAATGVVTDTDVMMAYVKQLVTELQVVDEFMDVPAANNVLNAQINEVLGNKEDTAADGAVTTTDTMVAYVKQLVTAAVADATLSASRKKVVVDDLVAADITGTATRFTITGGPIRVLSLGAWVSTAIPAGANTLQFGYTPAGGGGANTLSGATDTASAAADQLFMLDGVKATGPIKTTDVGVLAGGQLLTSTPVQGIILAPGIVTTIFSAGPPATGAMTVFMEYEPMSPSAAVA